MPMGVKLLPTFTIMLYISILYAFTLGNNFFASKARSALESQVSYGSAGYFIRDT